MVCLNNSVNLSLTVACEIRNSVMNIIRNIRKQGQGYSTLLNCVGNETNGTSIDFTFGCIGCIPQQ